MKKINWGIKRLYRRFTDADRFERGQVLVIVTLAMIGLVAFVGLVVDVGLVFIGHGKLRRSVDAAALAAASNFSKDQTDEQRHNSALEFLVLNGINIVEAGATVDTCDSLPGDKELCTCLPGHADPCVRDYRKLVRVNAQATVQLAFLSVIGIDEVPIYAEAIGEAAALDVVLVIDASDSMAKDTAADTESCNNQCQVKARDASVCNPMNCKPFDKVKAAAKYFAGELDYDYDRIAVVKFDREVETVSGFSKDEGAVKTAIGAMKVIEPDLCNYVAGTPSKGPCRKYELKDPDDPSSEIVYVGLDCLTFSQPPPVGTGNPATCTTTNIGGGLERAYYILTGTKPDDVPGPFGRPEALWVVILLTDGAANAPSGYCKSPWHQNPYCRSNYDNSEVDDKWTRYCYYVNEAVQHPHILDYDPTFCAKDDGGGGEQLLTKEDNIKYNTDDYARDWFDVLGRDQNALIYTIGLGEQVKYSKPEIEDKGAGQRLLEYGVRPDVGGGFYIYSPSDAHLVDAFKKILENISTRLTK